MRIIAGSLGGRQLVSPKTSKTHPMGDKIRGALFNTLGDIEGLELLDAFAGSGAIGLEAISRGASRVTAIDADDNCAKTIAINAANLGVERKLTIVRARVATWLATANNRPLSFDIVVADPPYDEVQLGQVYQLTPLVRSGGVLVMSLPPIATPSLADTFELASRKQYGDAVLWFYRKNQK